MARAKNFVGVSSVIIDGKTVAVCASNGKLLKKESGLSLTDCLAFFFELRRAVKKSETVVFVCYGFSRDNEFMFRELSNDLKDRLFQSHTIKRRTNEIEYEQSRIYNDLLRLDPASTEYELADFEKSINDIALSALGDVNFCGYDVKLRNGKMLTVQKDKTKFVLFDIYGFFRTSLQAAFATWLKKTIRVPKIGDEIHTAVMASFRQAELVADLATQLNDDLEAHGIRLRRYHGTGAVANWILARGNAKTQFHNYRHKQQNSSTLHNAVSQAYFAGRAEQFKIGHVDKPIYVYDLNSAYAYAATFLPILLQKPRLCSEWIAEPFSLWFCEYDFSTLQPYFGYLPNRERGRNHTNFKTKGRGFFWQPELSYIMARFPECVKIGHGFALPYEVAPFTECIQYVYDLRGRLKAEKHPLEKVLKLALSSIYGKFCQRDKGGYYYNQMYAGYITAIVRARLMQLTENKERSVICFLTDAVHTTEKLDIELSDELGGVRMSEYQSGVYLDNGVYSLKRQDGTLKQATRGFKNFDFDKAVSEFANKRSYTAALDLFVSYNLYALLPFKHYDYLTIKQQAKRATPLETSMRRFAHKDQESVFDSQILTRDSGLESGLYMQNDFTNTDAGRDTILSERI